MKMRAFLPLSPKVRKEMEERYPGLKSTTKAVLAAVNNREDLKVSVWKALRKLEGLVSTEVTSLRNKPKRSTKFSAVMKRMILHMKLALDMLSNEEQAAAWPTLALTCCHFINILLLSTLVDVALPKYLACQLYCFMKGVFDADLECVLDVIICSNLFDDAESQRGVGYYILLETMEDHYLYSVNAPMFAKYLTVLAFIQQSNGEENERLQKLLSELESRKSHLPADLQSYVENQYNLTFEGKNPNGNGSKKKQLSLSRIVSKIKTRKVANIIRKQRLVVVSAIAKKKLTGKGHKGGRDEQNGVVVHTRKDKDGELAGGPGHSGFFMDTTGNDDHRVTSTDNADGASLFTYDKADNFLLGDDNEDGGPFSEDNVTTSIPFNDYLKKLPSCTEPYDEVLHESDTDGVERATSELQDTNDNSGEDVEGDKGEDMDMDLSDTETIGFKTKRHSHKLIVSDSEAEDDDVEVIFDGSSTGGPGQISSTLNGDGEERDFASSSSESEEEEDSSDDEEDKNTQTQSKLKLMTTTTTKTNVKKTASSQAKTVATTEVKGGEGKDLDKDEDNEDEDAESTTSTLWIHPNRSPQSTPKPKQKESPASSPSKSNVATTSTPPAPRVLRTRVRSNSDDSRAAPTTVPKTRHSMAASSATDSKKTPTRRSTRASVAEVVTASTAATVRSTKRSWSASSEKGTPPKIPPSPPNKKTLETIVESQAEARGRGRPKKAIVATSYPPPQKKDRQQKEESEQKKDTPKMRLTLRRVAPVKDTVASDKIPRQRKSEGQNSVGVKAQTMNRSRKSVPSSATTTTGPRARATYTRAVKK